jgi:RNA polymerase primary sigma factor
VSKTNLLMTLNKNYYSDLSKFDNLSFEQTKELSQKLKEGDSEALNQMIQSNLKLVVFYAKQYYNEVKKDNIIEYDDLISEGNIGLIKACHKYDPEQNVKFSYFAGYWIKSAIGDYITKNRNLIRHPQYPKGETCFVNGAINETVISNGQTETIEVSIESEEDYQKQVISKLLGRLTEVERFVIESYYEINREKATTHKIANQLNLTNSRVSQIMQRAMTKLRSHIVGNQKITNAQVKKKEDEPIPTIKGK